jgi:hypothetical protein
LINESSPHGTSANVSRLNIDDYITAVNITGVVGPMPKETVFVNKRVARTNSALKSEDVFLVTEAFSHRVLPFTRAAKPGRKSAAPEEEFLWMASQNPAQLIELVQAANMRPPRLTFAAEAMGFLEDSTIVKRILLPLLSHPSALVREGAVYGISRHIDANVSEVLRNLSKSDPSPGVREAATEALDQI